MSGHATTLVRPAAASEPVTVTDGWRRLAVGMLFVNPARELVKAIPLLIALLFAGHSGNPDSHQPPWSLIGVGVVVAIGVLRWCTTRYQITDTHVRVRKGLIRRRLLTVPRDRVRTVDVSAHPFQRVLGLVRVEVGTGTSDRRKETLALDGLATGRAATLRDELLHRASEPTSADPATPPASEEDLAVFRPRWIGYAPATLSGAVTALFLLGLGWRITGEAHLHPDKIGVVRALLGHLRTTPLWQDAAEVAVAGALLIGLLSVAGYILAFWGFRLTRTRAHTLQVRRGLATTRAVTIEERRLRGVELSEPLLLRAVGGARCIAIATGLRVGRGSERGGSLLLPPAPRAVAVDVASRVSGAHAAMVAPLIGHGPAARRRRYTRALGSAALLVAVAAAWWWLGSLPGAVVLGSLVLVPTAAALAHDRFASLGHLVVDGWLVTRVGSLIRRRSVLAVDGVIGINLRQSYFQRRAGVSTLTATTAAGRGGYRAVDVDDAQALVLARALVPDQLAGLTTGTA
jgi:putative membrane protein